MKLRGPEPALSECAGKLDAVVCPATGGVLLHGTIIGVDEVEVGAAGDAGEERVVAMFHAVPADLGNLQPSRPRLEPAAFPADETEARSWPLLTTIEGQLHAKANAESRNTAADCRSIPEWTWRQERRPGLGKRGQGREIPAPDQS